MDDDIEEVVYEDGTTADVAVYEYLKYRNSIDTDRVEYLNNKFIIVNEYDTLDYEFEAPSGGVVKICIDTLEGKECEIGILRKSDYIKMVKGELYHGHNFVFRKTFNELEDTMYSVLYRDTYVMYVKNKSDSRFSLKLSLEYVPKKGIVSELSRKELDQLTKNKSIPRNFITNLMIAYTLIPLSLVVVFSVMTSELLYLVLSLMFLGTFINPIILYFDAHISRKHGPFPKSTSDVLLYIVSSMIPILGYMSLLIYLANRKRARRYPRPFL